MSNCLRHKTGGLIISKLFREIENLYESDKDAFKLLLREARKMNPEKEEKENTFVSWLRDSQEYALSANKITSSLNFLSALYLKAGVMSVPILKMDSEEQIIHVLDILHRNKMPRIHSKKQLQGYLFAVNVFLEYLRNRNKAKDDSKDNKFQADADHEDIMYVDFTHPSGFAYTRPNYYQFDGEKIVPVKNWTKLYVGVSLFYKICCSAVYYGYGYTGAREVQVATYIGVTTDGICYAIKI